MKNSISAVLVLSIWLSGCSGSGDGLDNSGQPLSGGTTAVPLAANFQAIQDNVFTPVCIVCHAGAAAPLGLKLDNDNSFAFLVGIASSEEPGLQRVNPGDPDNSYLIQKLEGTATVGGQMPLGRSALPQTTIDLVRQWIAEGAQNTSAPEADSTIAPIVKSITPDNGSTVTTFPTTILAVFSQPMDATSVNSGTIALLGSGGDGTFEDGNEVSFASLPVALSAVNPRAASVDLSRVTTTDDTYRITLVGTGGNVIMNQAALTLDGDNNGTPGGDFESTFTVAAAAALPTGGAGSGSAPALQTIQSSVFTPICTVCHAGPGAPEGLQLGAGNSLSMLVNVPSSQSPGMLRVKPGDPNNSYLIKKLEGTASVGGQMPRGGPFLPQATIDFIRQWITDGASATDSVTTSGGTALPPPPPPVVVPLQASWRSIQDKIFTPICTACHIGDDAPRKLRLDEANSYALLVNQRSKEDGDFQRVDPGNANASYLIKVLEGTTDRTPRMPFGGPYLPQETIDKIRQWIDDGALQ